MSTAPPSPASKPAPPPDVRVLRVAQVDAGRLDDELVSLLREQFARVFARVSPGAVTRRRSELTLLLDALVFYFTVWSHRPTLGSSTTVWLHLTPDLASGAGCWHLE